MRILMTTDTYGGVWTYALELTRELQRRGVDVVLTATGRALSPDQRRDLHAARIQAYARECALEWMPDAWADVERTGEWLVGLAHEVEPDVVHLNEYAHARLAWEVPVLAVGHSCAVSWYEAVHGGPAPPQWDRYRAVVTDALAAADMLVAPTRWMLAQLECHYAPDCERFVIPNGRDPRSFAPRAKEPFVLTAGRVWDEAKNLAALDRVAPRLAWPVVAAGDAGAARPASLRLVGRVDSSRLAELLARAAVFALPARYEPFGLGPLEAALAGCALVLGDIPSLREVWGPNALYADPADDEAIAAALRRVLEDETLRRRAAADARARALTLTPDRMADAYLDGYERLATRARPLELELR
jgi:glycosyltransferase involved in cell wall biosynthesis